MAAPNKRILKLQEFVAHSGNVNCLALGHKSGYVLVTGGDDKKVNLWAVGKSNCIMSLSGHTTPIQCVRFGHTENQVCAGSQAGTLKIWDLEAARILRSLTGHKSAIRAIEFHPYGDFITSGSADTSVKLWDIRRKGCIFTYKGHTEAVNSLKFSPDGQWIASGGEEGLVKLWDLRMGRMLKEFPEHSGPVTSIEFHPHEFLLASASRDNAVNFWDLEHFNLVSTTSKDIPHSSCLHFCSGGDSLYAAGNDILRKYLWEPARTVSSLHIPWGKVQDIVAINNKLMGASMHQMSVSLWAVDTTQLVNTPDPTASPDHTVSTPPFTHGNSLRKSFNKQKPSPEAKKSISVKTIEESERSETDPEDETLPDIPNVHDYRAVFQPNRTLNRSPPPLSSVGHYSPPSSQQYSDEESITMPTIAVESMETVSAQRRRSISPHELVSREPPRRLSSREDTSDQEQDFPVNFRLSNIHHSASETSIPRVNTVQQKTLVKQQVKATSQSSIVSKIVVRETKSDRGPTTGTTSSTPRVHQQHFTPALPTTTQHSPTNNTEDFIPMSTDRPTGLDIDDFLPKSYHRNLEYSQSVPDIPESEVLTSLMRGHDSLMAVMDARNRNLEIIYSLWQNKGLKTAVDTAVNMSDTSVIVDFLGVITNRPGVWNLDICVVVLPAIQGLLQSKFETYMRAGCDALRLIMRNFSPVIRTNVMSGSAAIGVDISREERYNKCVKCYNNLVSIRAFLLKRQTMQGPLGQSFRELHVSLQAIDTT